MRRWVAALAAVSALLLAYTCLEAFGPGRAAGPAGDGFQRLTGGLGMGAVEAPYWDFSTFDPRLEADCTCSVWPVPGGFLFSPEHRRTVWDPPERLWFAVAEEPARWDRGE